MNFKFSAHSNLPTKLALPTKILYENFRQAFCGIVLAEDTSLIHLKQIQAQ